MSAITAADVPWATVEAAMGGIIARRWYTNHGPVAQAFERRAAEALTVKHAIGVTNPTIGLLMLAEALGLSGQVLLSALAPRRCVQALMWAGLTPVFSDVDAETLGLAEASLRACRGIGAVLGTPGGQTPDEAARTESLGLAYFGYGLLGHAGPVAMEVPCAGDAAGIGCVTTNDDRLAARLRNIRSSYGAGPAVPVVRTANGRLSEIQAEMAMVGLEAFGAGPRQLAMLQTAMRDWRVVPFGCAAAVVMDETTQRDLLLSGLIAAGVAAGAPIMDGRAAGCRTAAALAARIVTVPLHNAADPALAAVARRVR